MLITEGTPEAIGTKIVDRFGNKVNRVRSFDTETGEIEIYVTIGDMVMVTANPLKPTELERKAVTAKGWIFGLKAINKKGEQIK